MILKILAAALPLGLADAYALGHWEELERTLEGLFGLELGLLIFLNALGVVFVIDVLGERCQLPGLQWFYRLPAAPTRRDGVRKSGGPPPPRRWRATIACVISWTVLFWAVDTLVFPFLPVWIALQFEIILIALGVAGQLVLTAVRGRGRVAPAVSS